MNGFFSRGRNWIALVIAVLAIGAIRVPFTGLPATDRPPLELADLPASLLQSWLRMAVSYVGSLFFAITVGTLAATNERRAKVLLPVIDVLQSVPILGFFPAAVYWFVRMGGPSVGVEAAVIFLIFTCQSWNLVFGVYDGIRTIPVQSLEAARAMGFGDLAMFRHLYLPAAFPRIVENSVLSWANGWYFLMACEIIALGPMSYRVPGIGSFLASAMDDNAWERIAIGLVSLVALIVVMDIFVWKPLRAAATLFRFESTKRETPTTTGDTLFNVYRKSIVFLPFRKVLAGFVRVGVAVEKTLEPPSQKGSVATRSWKLGSLVSMIVFWVLFFGALAVATVKLSESLMPPWEHAPHLILGAVGVSALRIFVAYVFSLAWIVPFVYWAHRKPFVLRYSQTLSQIAASVPATGYFPLIIYFALRIVGFEEVAVLLLLVTGMQWYLLFNVLGGATNLPNDFREVSDSLGVRRWLYVKRVFLPALVPALVTGSITAIGGGWNALIISEYFKFNGETHAVFGVGSLIARATYESGDEKLLAMSLLVMVAFIIVLNRFLWQPLYGWAERKFRWED